MTTVYGVTRFGARLQIAKQLKGTRCQDTVSIQIIIKFSKIVFPV